MRRAFFVVTLLLVSFSAQAANVNPKDFPSASALSGTEKIPAYQSGWKTATPADVETYIDGQKKYQATVSNIAALQTLSSGKYQTVYVQGYATAGDGGGGAFVWIAGDYSAEVSADAYHGIYVSSAPGSGAWIRSYDVLSPEFFGAVGDGATDDTANLQAWLNAPANLKAAYKKTYVTSATLFNQQPNREIDFNFSVIQNQTNSRYALVSVTTDLTTLDDTSLNTLMTERHYGAELGNVSIKNLTVVMMPNTGTGGNLGVGFVYCRDSTLDNYVITSSNGNALEIRNSLNIHISNASLTGHRSYGAFSFMSKNTTFDRLYVSGGSRCVVFKMNRDGDPDVNSRLINSTVEDGNLYYYFVGGTWIETVFGHEIYVTGHEIVRNIEVSHNRFIGNTTPVSYTIGCFADKWNIHDNEFINAGSQSGQLADVGNIGNSSDGGTEGKDHRIHDNKYIDIQSLATTVYMLTCDTKIYNEKFTNLQAKYITYLNQTTKQASVTLDFYHNDIEAFIQSATSVGDNGLSFNGFTAVNFMDNKIEATPLYSEGYSLFSCVTFLNTSYIAENNYLKINYSADAGVSTLRGFHSTAPGVLANNKVTIAVDADMQALGAYLATSKDYVVNNDFTLVGTSTATNRALSLTTECYYLAGVYTGAWTNGMFDTSAGAMNNQAMRRIVYGSGIPTAGTWQQGDLIYFYYPATGGYAGAVCISGGTPGTWRYVGEITVSGSVLTYGVGTNLTSALGKVLFIDPTADIALTHSTTSLQTGYTVTIFNTSSTYTMTFSSTSTEILPGTTEAFSFDGTSWNRVTPDPVLAKSAITVGDGSPITMTFDSGASTLQTITFDSAGKTLFNNALGVGNSEDGDVTATTATKKIQIFDASGTSLGYLQVYSGS